MRIAGNTIRRNYLSRYEKNYSDKYDSERKLYSGRQFNRASENPINAARALRIRKTQAEVETYQTNLKTADSVYTIAETSMLTVSSIIQNVYEKLVEGAHGTRNQDDLNILAMEIDNYAEEMVQSLNVDVADRKVFGGLNNDTVAFKIESSGYNGEKYVTYNGVAVNSSNDPQSFPYSGTSYLDIGIGMSTDEGIDRIDDQTALPITFNGAECTGCGMTRQTAAINFDSLSANTNYVFDMYAGGKSKTISFTTDANYPSSDSKKAAIEQINEELKKSFRNAPELKGDGSLDYIGDNKIYSYGNVNVSKDAVDLSSLSKDTYYSVKVTLDGKTRVVNFLGGDDDNTRLQNLDTALKEQYGEDAYADGNGQIHLGSKYTASVMANVNDVEPLTVGADGKLTCFSVDASGNVQQTLEPGKHYAFNICTPEVDSKGNPLTDENGDTIYNVGKMVYFSAGADANETLNSINDYIVTNQLFGDSTVPYINDTGTFVYDKDDANIIVSQNPHSQGNIQDAISEIKGYPHNIIQLVLDSGKLLREGDQDMVARYADLIYASLSNLSIAITDLGTHSKFIEFNEDRLSEIQINLDEKQNDIESTDMPSEITNWKVLESVYNASLQMGASILSQSIFNYIS